MANGLSLVILVTRAQHGTNIETTLRTNNDDICIINYTNTSVVIAANDRQREVQNDKVQNTVPSERTNTNNADDKATVIAATATYTDSRNDKEEETVYRVTDSYDFYNINSYLQWTFFKNDTHQFDLTFISSKPSATLNPSLVIIPVPNLNSGIKHICSTSCGPSNQSSAV